MQRNVKQMVYMHGISIAQTKLQTLILKLVLNLKGRYRGFSSLQARKNIWVGYKTPLYGGKVVPAALYWKEKLTLKEICNLVPEWYTVHCEIQAFIKLAGCECIALMLTWQYVQEIFLGCETRVSTKKA